MSARLQQALRAVAALSPEDRLIFLRQQRRYCSCCGRVRREWAKGILTCDYCYPDTDQEAEQSRPAQPDGSKALSGQ